MRKVFTKLTKKLTPLVDKAFKWAVRSSFEMLKLASLAGGVMHYVSAARVIEYGLAGITVFAAVWFTKFWK